MALVTVVNGDNFIILHPGANDGFLPEQLREHTDLIRQADYLIMQLEIPPETILEAAKIAGEAGTKVILNPAVPAKVVDTTSAGDTFIAALCCRLLAGDSLDGATSYAVRASAITVSRSGAAESILCAYELEAFPCDLVHPAPQLHAL